METEVVKEGMGLLPKIAMWYAAVHICITAIAAVTATKKDDKVKSIMDKIGKLLDRIGIQLKSPK